VQENVIENALENFLLLQLLLTERDFCMKKEFRDALENSPIIAAIKDEDGLKKCLTCDSQVIFILYGDICSISDIVSSIKDAGKIAMVHLDLITGLSSKEIAVDFIKKYTQADGIITTKPPLIKRAKELGLYTILRLFLIDSMAYENIERQTKTAKPDLIEILPALMPKIVAKVCSISSIPVIAGGLVSDKEDIMALLQAGVTSVSSTNEKIWFL
jgi:glycerol-3-phosphate responsive antiterminator